MAFSIGGSADGGGRRRRRFGNANGALSEINIIPLVDVVLVLLIIFMLTAHVMDFGLDVQVPKVKVLKETPEVLPVVTIQRGSKLYLNEKPINIHDIPAQLAKRFKNEKIVYLAADQSVTWDTVAQVMAELSGAGIGVRAVTKPLESIK